MKKTLVRADGKDVDRRETVGRIFSVAATQMGVVALVHDVLFGAEVMRTVVIVANQNDIPPGFGRCEPRFHCFAAMRAISVRQLGDYTGIFVNDHGYLLAVRRNLPPIMFCRQ